MFIVKYKKQKTHLYEEKNNLVIAHGYNKYCSEAL